MSTFKSNERSARSTPPCDLSDRSVFNSKVSMTVEYSSSSSRLVVFEGDSVERKREKG